jgi:hypothetical protein
MYGQGGRSVKGLFMPLMKVTRRQALKTAAMMPLVTSAVGASTIPVGRRDAEMTAMQSDAVENTRFTSEMTTPAIYC